jgi:hypothetical protein
MTAVSWAGHGRADEQDRVHAAHGRIQRVRVVEIVHGDLDVAVQRTGGIADQRRGGWCRVASSRAASEPTLPVAPVTKIMVSPFG